MLEIWKQKIIVVVEIVHRWVFGHEMSPTMKDFLRHFSWSFFGVVFSSALLFSGSIVIGRILGPSEFGKYNLVLAISNMAVVFMLFGFDTTAIKFISSSNSEEERKKYLSNSFWALFILSLVVFSVAFFISSVFAHMLNTDTFLIRIAFGIALILAFKAMLDSFAKAFYKFKYQAFVKIIESSVFFIIILVLYFFRNAQGYIYFLIPSALSSIFAVVLYGKAIRLSIVRWSKEAFLNSKRYLKLIVGVSLAAIIINTADKLFITKYLGIKELGIYSAYLMSSTIIFGQLTVALSNVFFPMMNKINDKAYIIKKIDRMMIVAFVPFVFCVSMLSFIIIKLFGSQYEINWIYIFILAVVTFLQVIVAFYGAIVSSSHDLFAFSTKIYYLKPVFIGCLYVVAYNTHNLGLIPIFMILAGSYLFDIMNTKVAFALVTKK